MSSDDVIKRLDRDGNGSLSKAEIVEALKGGAINSADLGQLVNDGKLPKADVDAAVAEYANAPKAPTTPAPTTPAATTPPASGTPVQPAAPGQIQASRERARLIQEGTAASQSEASAQEALNKAEEERLARLREAERIQQNNGRDLTDRLLGDWAGDGDLADVSREGLRGTFNLAGRAWDATKGTFKFLVTDPNASAFTTAITGIGGGLLLSSLIGPKIDEITGKIPGIGGFLGGVIKLGVLVVSSIGGIALANKMVPAAGRAIYGDDGATAKPPANAANPAASGAAPSPTTNPAATTPAPTTTTPAPTTTTPAPTTTTPAAPARTPLPQPGAPPADGQPIATRTTDGTPKLTLVGGDPEQTQALNGMIAFYRGDYAGHVGAQTGDANRRSFGDLALVGGGVGGGRYTASDVAPELKLETVDRHGNAVVLTSRDPAPTTPGYDLKVA